MKGVKYFLGFSSILNQREKNSNNPIVTGTPVPSLPVHPRGHSSWNGRQSARADRPLQPLRATVGQVGDRGAHKVWQGRWSWPHSSPHFPRLNLSSQFALRLAGVEPPSYFMLQMHPQKLIWWNYFRNLICCLKSDHSASKPRNQHNAFFKKNLTINCKAPPKE